MLFFNIINNILCLHSSFVLRHSEICTATHKCPGGHSPAWSFCFSAIFSGWEGKEVCSINSSGQNGEVKDQEAGPRSPKEFEVHLEIHAVSRLPPSSQPQSTTWPLEHSGHPHHTLIRPPPWDGSGLQDAGKIWVRSQHYKYGFFFLQPCAASSFRSEQKGE